MVKSMTFNGIRMPEIILLEGRSKPPFAQRKHEFRKQDYGYRLKKTTTEPLPISQPIGFVVDDDYNALELRDELTNWLITDEPAPLQFDDEPGRTYYALIENSIDDFSRFAYLRQGTLQFTCPDPYAHGDTKKLDVEILEKTFLIGGQTITPWTVNVTFLEGTNRFELIGSNGLYLLLNYTFVAGDRLQIDYVGRKVFLNGNDLRSAVSMSSNYVLLKPGEITLKASHDCDLIYDERYY
ncbi:phage tail family protein [Cytobacillus sp. Sa5YUA1]|uniref:Phage tail family protein n=1 Tax=Cytobacillus stercorigallinarum TaxID=2762240 RepID=A0ABR8QNP4_9BACI|nr:distal tail protein Dit [Cytobacillus stercorigallinarum]MBD7937131.1 phage tail family protein [Cytobacillus stercorigallinarum]